MRCFKERYCCSTRLPTGLLPPCRHHASRVMVQIIGSESSVGILLCTCRFERANRCRLRSLSSMVNTLPTLTATRFI